MKTDETCMQCESENGNCGTITDLFKLIDQVNRRLKTIYSTTIEKVGVTPPQYQLLAILWESDSRQFKDLAAAMGCSKATITSHVDALQKRGYVKRVPHPEDRRSLLASLTPKGRRLKEHGPVPAQIFGNCCRALSDDEFATLGELLQKLNHSIGKDVF